MKVIDILNKIANKEEIPLIKFNNRILHYDYLNECFEDKKDNSYSKMEVYYEDLNDEVEIIEEPKKIEKLEKRKIINGMFNDEISYLVEYDLDKVGDKINEIIDYINKEVN